MELSAAQTTWASGKDVEEALGACGRLGVGRRRRVALTAARTLGHLDERDVAVAEVVQVRGQGAHRGAFVHRQLQDTVDRAVTRDVSGRRARRRRTGR